MYEILALHDDDSRRTTFVEMEINDGHVVLTSNQGKVVKRYKINENEQVVGYMKEYDPKTGKLIGSTPHLYGLRHGVGYYRMRHNGKKHSVKKYYCNDEMVKTVTKRKNEVFIKFSSGKGLMKVFNKDGSLSMRGEYFKGMRHGLFSYYRTDSYYELYSRNKMVEQGYL